MRRHGAALLAVIAVGAVAAVATAATGTGTGRSGAVVFVRDTDPPTGGSGLELLDAGTGVVRELIHASGQVVRGAISPDGRLVAYDVQDGRTWQLRVIGTDGQGDRLLAAAAGVAYGTPAWTPDARRLAYARSRVQAGTADPVPGSGEIYSVAADGTGERRLTTDHRDDSEPAVTPDGRSIVFSRQSPAGRPRDTDLWIMGIHGGRQRRLTHDPAEEHSPAVSPDGRLIALERCTCNLVKPHARPPRRQSSLQVVDIDGHHRRTLARSLGNDYAAAWSPDGTQIAFTSDRADHHPAQGYYRDQLYVADLEGGAVHRLLRSGYGDSSPTWARGLP